MKVTSVFIKWQISYACKITWIEFLITLCLVKNSIQISKRRISSPRTKPLAARCECLHLIKINCCDWMKVLMHHSQRAARSFVRGLEIRLYVLIWFEKPYKQLELVSHRDIQTLENNVWKHSRFALEFSYIVFSCLDIPVKHSLSLFIYYFNLLLL
jgi:hypothetical protein